MTLITAGFFGVIKGALIAFANLAIESLAAVLLGMLGLLPEFPPVPGPPSVIKAINFFYPVGQIIMVIGVMFTAYMLWQAWLIVSRWIKAV